MTRVLDGACAAAVVASDRILSLFGFESRRATPSDLGNTSDILGVHDPGPKTLTTVTDALGSRVRRELTVTLVVAQR